MSLTPLAMVFALFTLTWSTATLSSSAEYGHSGYQSHFKKTNQDSPRDDRAFAQLWLSLHDCKTNVYVENGRITSEYLRRRGYSTTSQSQKGYEVFSVDERFEGFKVVEILLPTTWPIVAITVNAPVETVKRQLEKTRGLTFSHVGEKQYLRKLDGSKFEIFPNRAHSASTVIQCDSEQH